MELTVGESVKKLSDVTFGIEGWSCDDSQVLQPGTVVDAVAKYRLTENLTITANVRIKVSCSATSAVHKSGTSDPAVIRCTGVLEAFQGLTVDGKTLTNGKEIYGRVRFHNSDLHGRLPEYVDRRYPHGCTDL